MNDIKRLLNIQSDIIRKQQTIEALKAQLSSATIQEKAALKVALKEYTRSRKQLETALNNELTKIEKDDIEMNEKDIYKFMQSLDYTAKRAYSYKKAFDYINHVKPSDLVAYVITDLKTEKEDADSDPDSSISIYELASFYNLDNVRSNKFIQIAPIDSSDWTNAPSAYLSDLHSDDDLLDLVNEALEIEKVTHSSGLRPEHTLFRSEK